jgi:hypothetical protein
MQVIFSKAMFGLGVGWIHFHETTPIESKSMFGYGGLFGQLKGNQLFINKP